MAVLPTDEAGVVLLPAVENLNDPLQLPLSADEFIQLALLGSLGQGDAVAVEKFPLGGLGLPLFAPGGRGSGSLTGGGLFRGGGAAAKELVEEGESGGAAVVLLVVLVLGGGHHPLHPLSAAESGHHLGGEVIQVLVADAHLFHHVVDGLDAQLPGAFEAQTLVFGGAAL